MISRISLSLWALIITVVCATGGDLSRSLTARDDVELSSAYERGPSLVHVLTAVPPDSIPNFVEEQRRTAVVLNTLISEYHNPRAGTFYSEGNYEPWCADFVSWILLQTGIPLTNPKDGTWRVPGVYTLRDVFESMGRYHPRGSDYMPKQGDVVLYGGEGHTNMIIRVYGDLITTIGGNELDDHHIHVREISRLSPWIMGFGDVVSVNP